MRRVAAYALAALPLVAFAADDMAIAREALRDGLWDVARTHAESSGGEDGREVIMESFAREERWDELSKMLSGWRKMDETTPGDEAFGANGESNDAYAYYSALSLAERGEVDRAAKLLAGAEFKNQQYHELAMRLKARLALESGDAREAMRLVKELPQENPDASFKCGAARIYAANGDMDGANRLWREVLDEADVSSREYAVAAANLLDEQALRKSVMDARDVKVRYFAALRLGRLLIEKPAAFEEGARMIRRVVKDAPDSEGAMDSAVALASVLMRRESWQDAEEVYRKMLEIWPISAHDDKVQSSHGWALRRLGRFEEAVEAFSRAVSAAKDPEAKALALLEQGDTLSESGKSAEALVKYREVLDGYASTKAAGKLKEVVRRHELETKGRELYKDYRFAEAEKAFAELAASDPTSAERARFLIAMCQYAQGQDAQAAKSARELAVLAKDPAVRREATLWLAKLAYNEGRWSESGVLFSRYADMAASPDHSPGALIWAARAALADSDFKEAVRLVTLIAEKYPQSPEMPRALMVQAEALMEQGRYDEAALVIERALADGANFAGVERARAEVLKADALFALGADNPAKYREALEAYTAVRLGESLSSGARLAISFKIGRTLEKLKRVDEAIDQYYTGVVLAYREGRQLGVQFDDEAKAAFSKAAFRLVDEFESRGRDFQAMHILELVISSGVSAADEAEKRLDRIQTKGKFL